MQEPNPTDPNVYLIEAGEPIPNHVCPVALDVLNRFRK